MVMLAYYVESFVLLNWSIIITLIITIVDLSITIYTHASRVYIGRLYWLVNWFPQAFDLGWTSCHNSVVG